MKRILTGAIACALMPAAANARLVLPDIVGPDMVVQQQSDARLWGWATPGSEVTATASWNQTPVSAIAGENGRWDLFLATPEASFVPYTITIAGDGSETVLDNVLVGEVWFCSGQSNMEMTFRGFPTQPVEGATETVAFAGRYPGIRVARVEKGRSYTPQDSVASPWKRSTPENARDFSALAFFYAQALTDILDVPVGIIDCSYGGSKVEGWQSREQLAAYPECDVDAEAADPSVVDWHRINVMYNAMVHPMIGYTIKGFLWNQGESNVGLHDTYHLHLRDMVADWRSKWGQGELPFYFVEIPGWDYGDPEADSAALLRESQHKAARLIPNSGIVSTSDLVYPFEVNDIHARKKKEIGQRLAYLACDGSYGIAGMPVEYPAFKAMTTEGDKALIELVNVDGGLTPNKELTGFTAAGDDMEFHPARAWWNPRIRRVEVTCPEVGDIKAVRYNFKNFAVGQVHNMFGLPLIPFRTDAQ